MDAPKQQQYVEPEDRATRVSDLVLRYGVILGKRFTRGQKRRFLAAAAQQFELYGYKSSLEEDKRPVKAAGTKRFFNLYAGDLSRAKYLFVTYYDTPVKRFGKGPVKAFDSNYNAGDVQASLVILLAVIVAVALAIWQVLLPGLGASGLLSLYGLAFVVLVVAVLALVTSAREGFAERDNLVRNSSSLTVLFDLAREARDAGLGDQVAFALVDEGCRSQHGLAMLEGRVGRRGPKRVFVDCLGNDGPLTCFTGLATPPAWEGVVEVARLSAERRKKYGDYLVCGGTAEGEDVLIDASSDTGGEKVMDRTAKLMELVRGKQGK